ncbi:endolytic transglycosylase MltG [Candidatus Saccharibacteria bacterium]|nr:endolytic transglycosylase MltG [Candidatus Saccharibacteria bacterium]
MRVLGLDVGEKRIGVAKADSDTRIAVPLTTIEVDGNEWQEIARLTSTQNTTFFVVGMPRSNEGNQTQQSLYVRNFAKTLIEKLPGAKIRFQDESLTSVEAENRLKARKKPYEKADIDAEAAAIILQDFLESFQSPTSTPPAPTNLIEKEVKKVKRKGKRVITWISSISVFIILALMAVGGFFWMKELRARERAEHYKELESQMVAEVFNFTIRPGETIMDIKKHLIEAGYSAEEVEAAFNATYDYDFLADRPAGASLEGYLYGETIEFYKTATVTEIINTFLKEMGRIISENDLVNRYSAKGLSLYQGITLASVVQKEAKEGDMPTVAQVFLTRLNYGIPLGSDVTVSYALDLIDPNRGDHQDNQAALQVDSCYNTRKNGGLPCGPISNPGLSALLAVAEPSDTSYLYFLTGDDGMMYYSYTEAEHNSNAARHCQALCSVSL